ncbi:hypothetical protein Tco_0878749 [Tanacetum coccineum]|uniref:Reverse transcriptase domain-containing protein n=1 Tax=Tanacetum coccineum TaxID=301880 RepID=A0ABQ5C265_9ASTR
MNASKLQSKFVKSIDLWCIDFMVPVPVFTREQVILVARRHLSNGLKRSAPQPMMPEKYANSGNLSSARLECSPCNHKQGKLRSCKISGDHRKVQLNELNELRDHAYENSLIYKAKTKRLHDSKIKNRVFNIGDRVLLFNSRLKIFSGKLKSRWNGPFTITRVFPYGTVELSCRMYLIGVELS